MKKITAIAVLLMLCAYGRLQGQTDTQPLNPGDIVPDVPLQLVNFPQQQARFSYFTDKLVILEFWSPHCLACAHMVALLDSLQQQFDTRIRILPVSSIQTTLSASDIKQFIKGYKQRIPGGFSLPSVVEDSILSKLFPFAGVPQFIWIRNGIFKLRTDDVTAQYIQDVLHDKTSDIKTAPTRTYYNIDTRLEDFTAGAMNAATEYHLFKGEIRELYPATGFVKDTINGNRVVAVNSSAGGLFALAFDAPVPLYSNRVINQTGEARLFDDLVFSDSTFNGPFYNYEFTGNAGFAVLRKQMQYDLCHYFKIRASVEKQVVNSYVLTVTDTSLLKTSGNIEGNSLYEPITGDRVMYNQPVSVLVQRLNRLYKLPVLDETHLTANIDLRLPNDLLDVAAVNAMLSKQGLLLTKAPRPVEMFVLSAATGCTK
jgi:thiol-disulfide isomerase/thioredoxin